MPGVTITTAVRSGPTGVGENTHGQFFLAGTAERGPSDEAKLVRSMAEFESWYGGYTTTGTLWSQVKTYFEEGGQRAYVVRAQGASATAGTLTLVDRNGTPDDTIIITAGSTGAWSDTLKVAVTDGAVSGSNTFKVHLYLDDVLVWSSRECASPADAISVINSSGVKHLIVATDANSGSTSPDDNPKVVSATALSAGTDDTPTTDELVSALDYLTYSLGTGAVAIPGSTGATAWDGIIEHAVANNRIALLAFASGDALADVEADVSAYYGEVGAEYAAFFYPWIEVPDPAFAGLTVAVSPEGFAAAARSKAISTGGPWMAGAGLISQSKYVKDLEDISATEKYLTRAQGDELDELRINPIRKIGNSFRVYGARSVSSDDDNWRYITSRDTMNYIVWNCEQRLEDLVFTTIDGRGHLFADIRARITDILEPIRAAGGLYEWYDDDGRFRDPGYSVTVTSENNPLSELATGKVRADVGVRISSVGDQILVTIVKSNLLASI